MERIGTGVGGTAVSSVTFDRGGSIVGHEVDRAGVSISSEDFVAMSESTPAASGGLFLRSVLNALMVSNAYEHSSVPTHKSHAYIHWTTGTPTSTLTNSSLVQDISVFIDFRVEGEWSRNGSCSCQNFGGRPCQASVVCSRA